MHATLPLLMIDRCNLTGLDKPGSENMADFFAYHDVEIMASLPRYSKENADGQI